MIPILFSANATTFTTNGLGRLSDAISCKVTEERNGAYELVMEFPITGNHYSELDVSKIIAAVPADGKGIQAFRIYKIEKPINGVCTIYAEHISYQLSMIPVMPFSAGSFSNALSALVVNAAESCPFTVWTDKTTSGAFSTSVPMPFRSLLGGVEGSLLDVYGTAEYEFDNYTIKAHASRGVDSGVVLRYGKNIVDIKQEDDIEATITGVCPYWLDSETNEIVTLPEKVVWSSHASEYPYKRTNIVDFNDKFETKPTVAQLRAAANSYISQEGFGVPKVNIEVSFVALWQTEEYKNLAALERVNLCDTVHVYFEKLGITAHSKVIKTEYNVLTERYEQITLGDAQTTLSQQISSSIDSAVSSNNRVLRGEFADVVDRQTDLITGALGGYVVLNRNADGEPYELLIMNTPDITTATQIIRFNMAGIGFSTNGYNGPYTQAWTIDGTFNTDYVFTDSLNAAKGKIGGWSISSSSLSKTQSVTVDNVTTQYQAFLQAPSSVTPDSTRAFGIQTKVGSGSWTNQFYVRYDGYLMAQNANITGTINARGGTITGTLTGGTLSGTRITGSELDISGTFTNLATDDSKYRIQTDSGLLLLETKPVSGASSTNTAKISLGATGGISITAPDIEIKGTYSPIALKGAVSASGIISASGAIYSSSTISATGSICSGGKASVWDSNAGGIMSAGGVLSLRANSSTTPGLYVTAYGSTTTTYDAGLYYNGTNDRWQSNKQIYAPSFYATGRIDVGTTSVTGSATVHTITQGREIELITQATGTCGVYDVTNSKWIVSMSSAGVRGPVASTTEVGFMSVADKTKLNSIGTLKGTTTGSGGTVTVPGTSTWTKYGTALTFDEAGLWLVIVNATFDSNSTGRRGLSIDQVTGTWAAYTPEAGTQIHTDVRPASATTYVRVVGLVSVAANDMYAINLWSSAGSSTSLTATVRYTCVRLRNN